MAKLSRKPKRPVLARAKQVLAAGSVLVAVGCGDDDGGTDAEMPIGVTAPDAQPDTLGVDAPAMDANQPTRDAGKDAGAPPPGLTGPDAGNDAAAPVPGLTPFDAG